MLREHAERPVLHFVAVLLVLGAVFVSSNAFARALQIPAGSDTFTLPGDRILCSATPEGWAVDGTRKRLRPPAQSVAHPAVEVVLAANAAACGTLATEKTTLVVTGPLPVFDPTSVVLSVDAGRLEVHGDALEGARIGWRAGDKVGSELCVNVTKDKGKDLCSIGVDRTLPADPRAVSLRWAPPEGRVDAEFTFDHSGTPLTDDQMHLPIAKVLVSRVFPLSHAVDVASGEGKIEFAHPDAVSSVDCGTARCDEIEGAIVVRSVPAASTSITVKARLLPHVFLARGDTADATPMETLSVLRCPLTMVSGEPLRNVDNLSVLVRLDKSCSKDSDQLKWTAGGETAEVTRVESLTDGVYVQLWIGRIASDRLTIVASRADDGSVLAVTNEKTWETPALRTSLSLPAFGEIDFIPRNRDAVLSVSPPLQRGKLVPVSVPGAYSVTEEKDGYHVRGDLTSGGYTALRFGYRYPGVPEPFVGTDFATLSDPVQRPIREASVPAPIGASSITKSPIVELICSFGKGRLVSIAPGTSPHIPYSERNSCRLTIHRERIPPEDGEQRIDIDVSVATVSGDRPEAKLTQHLVLRNGPDRDVIWLRGAKEQFDRYNVHITHVIDETQYVNGSSHSEIPSAQWTVVTENASFKFYATATIPASLYRFSKDPQDLGTGPLALNFGVLSRLTWLDSDGHEGLVGLEAGVMALGLATDKDRQLALVAGPGISIPLGNVNQPTQASVNIHAWASYTIGNRTGTLVDSVTGAAIGTAELNHWAFIFGPSITIGNIGTFL